MDRNQTILFICISKHPKACLDYPKIENHVIKNNHSGFVFSNNSTLFSLILSSQSTMEKREKPTRMSVPQFGGWDHKVGDTDYSMVFSRARANKKQNKNDFNRHSIANEQELIVQKQTEHQPIQKQPEHQHDDSVVEDDSPN
ncbi:hypothetical protein CsSME_00035565 [Camellia sinensis var. sinensis]